MKNKFFYLLLFFVFLLGFLVRIVNLTSLPNGLDQDETAIGYNAYLINTLGKDEWGQKMPLYFKSFGDYKLPIYIYTVSFFEKFLGINALAVRLPSFLAGFLSIFFLFLVVKKLTKDKYLALVSSFLLAINPWSIFLSRAGFETNLATFFILAGFYFFYLYKEKFNLFFGFLFVIFFTLSAYTYNVTRLISPLILISLTLFYFIKSENKKIFFNKFILFLFLFFIFLIPFLSSFINNSGLKNDSSVLIWGGDYRANILEFRSYLINMPTILNKLFFNIPFLIFINYVSNLFMFFSVDFLFINGQAGMSGIGNNGEFYLFQLPLLILAIIYLFKKSKMVKNYDSSGFTIWFFVSLLAFSLSGKIPHGTRDFSVIIPLTFFSSIGLIYLFHLFINLKNKFLKIFLFLFVFLIISYSFLFFLVSYIFRFPIIYAQTWRPEDKALSIYLKKNEDKYGKIYIEDNSDFIYSSLVFYQKYTPYKFFKNAIHNSNALFLRVKKLGKYEFNDINLEKIKNKRKILLVTNGKNTIPNIKPIKIFYYPTRPIVLFSDNNFLQFPVTDINYKVYEIN